MQSLVAPMTSKESSKKVPFYYYTASAFPNSKHGFGLVNHCIHIFHRQARNQVSLFGCEMQTGRGVKLATGLMHALSRAEDRSTVQHKDHVALVWCCLVMIALVKDCPQ